MIKDLLALDTCYGKSIPLTLHSLGLFGVRYVPYLLNEYVGVLRDASHSQNLGNVVDDNESTTETISK